MHLNQQQIHYQKINILFDYCYEDLTIKKLFIYKSRFIVRII